jgi:two-component system sensor histidine kinase KdpD
MLARVAGRLVSPEGNPLPALLDELIVAFRQESAAIVRSPGDAVGANPGGAPAWTTVASAGSGAPGTPDDGSLAIPLTGREVLVLRGPGLTAEDRDILTAFAAQLATALESDRLHAEAAEADSLARANQLRSALLAAVSHDLRTPLASIKAASSSLLSEQLDFGPDETGILLHTIDDEADRLSVLVENLLDMSRLETGAMEILHRLADVEELVDSALSSLGPRGEGVTVDVDEDVPQVHTDPVLVERVLANLVDNALLHGAGRAVQISVGTVAGRVDVRVVDHGPGIRVADRERVFQPFQRLGDTDNRSGVGLGLAVSRGFAEAVGGELDLEDTPGGGCTMVLRLPATVDTTSSIIDADLDTDVVADDDVIPEEEASSGPAVDGAGVVP